jgi:RNA polymerase sigma factor (sigma-70 family)
MTTTASNGLRRVAARLSPDPATDGELLARFLAERDEDAFAEIVHRHGRMVLGTCRRVLGNSADADDAFQAAFVVLVRKAHALADRATVGNFLYGVAFHTALKAKAMAARRRTKEAHATTPEPAEDRSELLAALDEELARLPEKYCEPVVLCELEGRSRRDAAEALGVPEGTISSRLATAHRMLEKRLKSRGFGAVSVAMLLAGPACAVADSLAHAAVRSASAGPSGTVSQLVSEVTKMLLLHKLGVGAAVLAVAAVLVGIAYAVPGDTPPADKPTTAKATEPRPVLATVPLAGEEKEPAWKTEFRKAYGLKDGEVVRRVAPPYPECRAEYFRDEIRELYKRNKMDPPEAELNRSYADYFVKFAWKDGWTVPGLRSMTTPVKPDEGLSLGQVLDKTTGFYKTRIEAFPEVLEIRVTGDFVVRAGADPEKLASQLEKILRKECELPVSLSFKDVERDVYVLSGKYKAKPLPERKENEIEVYAVHLTDRKTDGLGGGSGNFQELIDHVERFVNHPVILGEVEGTPKRASWHYNYRSPFTKVQYAEDRDPEAVVKNVADQTGLTAKLEKRKVRVLVVERKP